MKKLLMLLASSIPLIISAQNVGVGTITPLEKLDVNGNINVSGTIKANGVAGQPNQVLGTNGTGNMAWIDINAYPNVASFITTAPTNWQVPAGITKIVIEMWGGGGGGNEAGGGGAGGYLKVNVPVTPLSFVNIDIGMGGSAGIDGEPTAIAYATEGFNAFGGIAATATNTGAGGAFLVSTGGPTPFLSYIGVIGQNGTPTSLQFGIRSPTNYFKIYQWGNGGAGFQFPGSAGLGGTATFDLPANTVIVDYNGNPGKMPGGGGASSSGSTVPRVGGNGMVVIHY